MASIALGFTRPEGREPALCASTFPAPCIRANASAIWLRFEFSTQTKMTRFTGKPPSGAQRPDHSSPVLARNGTPARRPTPPAPGPSGTPAGRPPLPPHHRVQLRRDAGGGQPRHGPGGGRDAEPAVRRLHPRLLGTGLHPQLGPAVAGGVEAAMKARTLLTCCPAYWTPSHGLSL